MIQLITNNSAMIGDDVINIRSFEEHDNFDIYSLNIIDLNSYSIWCTFNRTGYTHKSFSDEIHLARDFETINSQIENCKSKVLIVLPKNFSIIYGWKHNGQKELSYKKIKDALGSFNLHMLKLDKEFGRKKIYENKMIYAPTETNINNNKLRSEFKFIDIDSENIVLKNIDDESVLIISDDDRVYRSTIYCETIEEIKVLLDEIGLTKKPQDKAPEWISDFSFYNDPELKDSKDSKTKRINEIQTEINKIDDELERNKKYKSALYTNSKELEEIIYIILGELLGVKLTDFLDEKDEDFHFELDGAHFVGEIKGVTSNVKNEHISQLDVHYQRYIDKNELKNDTDIYQLLVINHQRKKPLNQRNEVHNEQIELAQRNGCLIIETKTLLKAVEKYRDEKISREKLIHLLKDKNSGILTL